jgi:hypothetical protein
MKTSYHNPHKKANEIIRNRRREAVHALAKKNADDMVHETGADSHLWAICYADQVQWHSHNSIHGTLPRQAAQVAPRRARPASVTARRPRQRAHRARATRTTASTSPPGPSDDDPAPGEAGPNHIEIIGKNATGRLARGEARLVA